MKYVEIGRDHGCALGATNAVYFIGAIIKRHMTQRRKMMIRGL